VPVDKFGLPNPCSTGKWGERGMNWGYLGINGCRSTYCDLKVSVWASHIPDYVIGLFTFNVFSRVAEKLIEERHESEDFE